MSTRAGQSGFTMVEFVIVAVIMVVVLGVTVSLVGGTQELADDTHAHSRAAKEHRRNLRALSNLLRGADTTTLTGFEGGGVATSLGFQRVTGVGLEERTYGEAERLEWRPSGERIRDVKEPGGVWLVTPTETRLVAKNVPYGGFLVRQEGTTLAIRLTTYYATGGGTTARTTSETAVSLRN